MRLKEKSLFALHCCTGETIEILKSFMKADVR